jgi:hypothetical protein
LAAEAAVVAEPLRSSKTMFAVAVTVAVTVTEAELSRSKKTTTAVVVVAAKELQLASPVRIVVDVIGTGVAIMAKDVIGTEVAILDAAERPVILRTLPPRYRFVEERGRRCRVVITQRQRPNGTIVSTERREC